MTNRKDNPKKVKYVFRPSTTTASIIELYQKESGGVSRTTALEDLIQLGGTVWLQKVYKNEE